MRSFKVALLALAAAVVSAQDLSSIPQCALEPALSALGATGCSETDFKCICSASSFLTSLLPAVKAACSAADLAIAESAAVALCASVGVTITIPGPATTAPAPTTPAPAPPASSSKAPAPSSSVAPAPVSSATGVLTVYVTVPCSASTPVVVSTKASNATIAGTVAPAASTSKAVFTGAAAGMTYNRASMLGGVVAVLGALIL